MLSLVTIFLLIWGFGWYMVLTNSLLYSHLLRCLSIVSLQLIWDAKLFDQDRITPWQNPYYKFSRERAVEVAGLTEWQQTGNCNCLLQDALVCKGYTFWQANRLYCDKPALYSTLLLPMRKPFITQSYALVFSCASPLSIPFPSTFPPLYSSLQFLSPNNLP